MQIDKIEQVHIRMQLKHPFETSFGVQQAIDKIILAVHAGGLTGWGESPVSAAPGYSYETVETAWHIQHDFLIPALRGADIDQPGDLGPLFGRVRGHAMAKAGLEAAVWDLLAKARDVSLHRLLGGTRAQVPVGVSIGVQKDLDALRERVESFVEAGYRRVKVKIKPGWDVAPVEALRADFPETAIMADANSAYTLDDAMTIKRLDPFDLLMIEQPLAHDDLLDHAALQRDIATPICLDESIHSVARAREAIALGSCRVINIKPARVGGWANAKMIHDLGVAHGLDLWVGGMLESGVGRAHNLALAALPGMSLPGDISGTDRYWHQDIIDHVFAVNPDGTMDVPDGPGIGVQVDRARLAALAVRSSETT
ncbi:MAG: o-succinylbenzoate synthase [Chloroflexi bacterium]|nr:o-succinylbenzoate synthase [Chloroflexota bacterium]